MDIRASSHAHETLYMRLSPIREPLDVVPCWPSLETEKPDDPFSLFADYRGYHIKTPEEKKKNRNRKRENGRSKKTEKKDTPSKIFPPLKSLQVPEKKDTSSKLFSPLKLLQVPEKKDTSSKLFSPLKLLQVPEKKIAVKKITNRKEKIEPHESEPPFKEPKIMTESKKVVLKNHSDRWVGSTSNHFKEAEEERQRKLKMNTTILTNKIDNLQQIKPKITRFDLKRSYEKKMLTKPVVTKDIAVSNKKIQNENSKIHFSGSVIDLEPPDVAVPLQSKTFPSQPHDIGLPNYGNNCFVNATLQALFVIPHFMDNLKKASTRTEDRTDSCVTILNEVMKARQDLSVENVTKHFKFFMDRLTDIHRSYATKQQEDASEFLIRLVNVIKLKVPQSPSGPDPIAYHFEFQMTEIHKCPECSLSYQRSLTYSSICLNLTSDTLDDCFSDYFRPEQLPISCTRCPSNHMEIATKFQTLPRVLIVSVNRYSMDLKKVMHPITAPPLLSTEKYIIDESCPVSPQFALRAQILHMGQTKYHGHYISQIYCDDNNWRSYNDKDVKVISTKEVFSSNQTAYVYLYFLQGE